MLFWRESAEPFPKNHMLNHFSNQQNYVSHCSNSLRGFKTGVIFFYFETWADPGPWWCTLSVLAYQLLFAVYKCHISRILNLYWSMKTIISMDKLCHLVRYLTRRYKRYVQAGGGISIVQDGKRLLYKGLFVCLANFCLLLYILLLN